MRQPVGLGRRPDRWAQVEPTLDQALDLPVEEREAFLREACGSDTALREELLVLVRSVEDATTDGFLESPVEQKPEPLHSGLLNNRYQIEGLLGKGGMGIVYRGRDLKLERDVAIKLIRRSLEEDDTYRKRFLREARAVSLIRHENICEIYDIGEEGQLQYIIMPLYEGRTLSEILRAEGPLSVERAQRYARQIATGLAAAHARNVVHRDIKPGNIFVTTDEVAKILDFGIAAVHETGLTQSGQALGTPAYMAPEVLRGDAVQASADVWSFGAIVAESIGAGQLQVRRRAGVDRRREKLLQVSRVCRSDLARDRPSAGQVIALLDAPTVGTQRASIAIGLAAVAVAVTVGWWAIRGVEPAPARPLLGILPAHTSVQSPEVRELAMRIAPSLNDQLRLTSREDREFDLAFSSYLEGRSLTEVRDEFDEIGVQWTVAPSVEVSGEQAYLILVLTADNRVIDSREVFVGIDGNEILVEAGKALESLLGEMITGVGRDKMAASSPSIGARAAYSEGIRFRGSPNLDSLNIGIEHLHAAIVEDSTYAAAVAGLSGMYAVRFGLLRDSVSLQRSQMFDSRLSDLRRDNGWALISSASVHNQTGNRDLARKSALAALEIRPGDVEAIMELAAGHFGEQNDEHKQRAIELMEGLAQKHPADWRPHRLLGFMYYRKEETDLAIDVLTRATQLAPQKAELWRLLGNAMWTAETIESERERYLAAYDEALRLQPDDPKTHSTLGNAYSYLGDFSKSIYHYKKATEHNPHDFQHWEGLGISLHAIGQLDSAKKAYGEAFHRLKSKLRIPGVKASGIERLRSAILMAKAGMGTDVLARLMSEEVYPSDMSEFEDWYLQYAFEASFTLGDEAQACRYLDRIRVEGWTESITTASPQLEFASSDSCP